MTDDELFHEFTRRVQDAVYDDLHVVVYETTSAPFTITWDDEFFAFDPVEAQREGLVPWVDRAVARIRLSREEEGGS